MLNLKYGVSVHAQVCSPVHVYVEAEFNFEGLPLLFSTIFFKSSILLNLTESEVFHLC